MSPQLTANTSYYWKARVYEDGGSNKPTHIVGIDHTGSLILYAEGKPSVGVTFQPYDMKTGTVNSHTKVTLQKNQPYAIGVGGGNNYVLRDSNTSDYVTGKLPDPIAPKSNPSSLALFYFCDDNYDDTLGIFVYPWYNGGKGRTYTNCSGVDGLLGIMLYCSSVDECTSRSNKAQMQFATSAVANGNLGNSFFRPTQGPPDPCNGVTCSKDYQICGKEGKCVDIPCGPGSGTTCPPGAPCTETHDGKYTCQPPPPCDSGSCKGDICSCSGPQCVFKSCSKVSDCGDDTLYDCVSGTCQFKCVAGCASDETCANGECVPKACLHSFTCGKGFKCDGSGTCVRNPAASPCSSSNPCDKGYTCKCGVCVQESCVETGCDDGENCNHKTGKCEKAAQCSAEKPCVNKCQTCDESQSPAVCVNKSMTKCQTCDPDTGKITGGCKAPKTCVNGKCQKPFIPKKWQQYLEYAGIGLAALITVLVVYRFIFGSRASKQQQSAPPPNL